MALTIIFLGFFIGITSACYSRDYGNGATVCVCTKNKCDTLPPVKPLPSGQYEIYTSSKAGARFDKKSGSFSNSSSSPNQNSTIFIDRQQKFQKMKGIGGAFTDSAGINILSLSPVTQDTLLNAYFSENGLQYSMGRIPMAGTDFSTRGYTYDDVKDDFELKHFALQHEDFTYKIPIIKKALKLTNNEFKTFCSAWTAPAWMKTNDNLTGISLLNISVYDVWANYYIKFLDGYRQEGINIWGLTTGNEPADGLSPMFKINDMGWTPLLMGQWVAENLGPKIRLNEYYSNIKIMIIDDQRVFFPWIPRYIFENSLAEQYVDGLAVHYYTDEFVPADVLSVTHFDFPDKFILATEACEGSGAQRSVILGSWERAEHYLNSIIDDLNNWSTGWMDWNIALNLEGGPTYVNNYVDSPIIVNKTADEFYKQPMFYALGHFAKFLRPDSVRISSTYSGSDIKHVTFERPDGGIVVSIFNPTDQDVPVTVQDMNFQNNLNIDIPKNSINSFLYWV